MFDGQMSERSAGQMGDMIPLLVRHEIQVLLNAGHTQADVARRTGVLNLPRFRGHRIPAKIAEGEKDVPETASFVF